MFYPVLKTNNNAVPAGLSLLLVYLNLFTTSTTNLILLFLSLNNSLLIAVVLKVSDVKVVVVPGLLMLLPTLKNSVLSKRVNMLTLLRMANATKLLKVLVTSLLNNSKLLLVMLPFKPLSRINLSLSALMPPNGLLMLRVFSLKASAVLIPTQLIMLFYLLVTMLMVLGRLETLGVLLGV